ncbi:hypothetical protein PVAND_012442 [Polypedilum vanderplanki]|uniref:Sushi, von Willebrand factor type A, EGF and pentraxin domain-containing protein 1 n=1 Tax=Polypedilum vanderplanki TaxID=319348 RepID=A0A9J6CMG4_POLVA|nr:hypothetical protein PVAND_012442 [Polypedilum vanderplanki]
MVRRKHQLKLIAIYGLINAINIAYAQKCNFPGSPAHSTVTFSDETLNNGAVASYTCERGFELLGPSRRVCDHGSWTPEGIPFCVLNVAAGKAPMQISTDGPGIPQKAIDGSTSSFFSAETCSLTKQERVPWWYVNLLEPYMVQLVRLDFGKSCCGNNKPATIVVRVGNNRPDLGTNPICNRFTGALEEGQPLFLPCNPPMPGAFVSVHLEVNQPAALSICEAFVYTDQALPIERCPTFRDQPPGALASYNGKCYIFYNRQPMNLRDALQFCRSRGGTLINESNPALQGFISWELWRRHRSDVSSQYWMGAVRSNEDRNTWKWIGGDDVSVSFWNLPGGDEDCARYDGSKGWLWSDTNCNTQLNFICQHQPKACGRPEQPPNSTMIAVKGYDVGSSVEYKCDEGHLLVGPSSRTCLETGFYNEFPPVCKYIECGLPASIPSGTYELVNSSVGYLSQVAYKCNEGYQMLGRAMLTCDIDERWNGPPPRCEIVECDPLAPNHKNSKVLTPNGTFYGSKAEIQCARGYKLDGPSFITCTASGQWSGPITSCIEDESIIIKTSTQSVPATTFTRSRTSTPSRKTSTSIRTSSRFSTTTTTTQRSVPISNIDLSLEEDNNDSDLLPGTVREDFSKPIRPVANVPKNNYSQPPSTSTTTTKRIETSTKNVQEEIDAAHPEDNEVGGTNNNRHNHVPDVNVPNPVDNNDETVTSSSSYGAKLSLSSIIALSSFGGFVFLAAIITTIVVIVRRNRTSTQHYRHRASPDCNTVASFDSSSSESRNGLNRYYRQAWENLHESASKNHNQLRRKETLDPPNLSRSRDNLGSRDLDRRKKAPPPSSSSQ